MTNQPTRQIEWLPINRLNRDRWRFRVAGFYGSPPGSHIGVWRTKWPSGASTLHGVNLRFGRRYVGPCLTLLVHWRRGGSA